VFNRPHGSPLTGAIRRDRRMPVDKGLKSALGSVHINPANRCESRLNAWLAESILHDYVGIATR
jgi:hypothetical protein